VIEDGVIVVEEGQSHDPEGLLSIEVHGHDLECAECTFTLNVVLWGKLVDLIVHVDLNVRVSGILSIAAAADEEASIEIIVVAGIVQVEVL